MTNKQIRERWPLQADRLIRNRNLYHEDNHRGFQQEKKVVYITGPTGSGKTKLATEMAVKSFLSLKNITKTKYSLPHG